jgi:predicted ArsR family transcriptional regulator
VVQLLGEHGYEPRRTGSTVTLVNCPFRALARRHTDLVCGMNSALITGLVEALAADFVDARLEPGDARCCVILTAREEVAAGSRRT